MKRMLGILEFRSWTRCQRWCMAAGRCCGGLLWVYCVGTMWRACPLLLFRGICVSCRHVASNFGSFLFRVSARIGSGSERRANRSARPGPARQIFICSVRLHLLPSQAAKGLTAADDLMKRSRPKTRRPASAAKLARSKPDTPAQEARHTSTTRMSEQVCKPPVAHEPVDDPEQDRADDDGDEDVYQDQKHADPARQG